MVDHEVSEYFVGHDTNKIANADRNEISAAKLHNMAEGLSVQFSSLLSTVHEESMLPSETD